MKHYLGGHLFFRKQGIQGRQEKNHTKLWPDINIHVLLISNIFKNQCSIEDRILDLSLHYLPFRKLINNEILKRITSF